MIKSKIIRYQQLNMKVKYLEVSIDNITFYFKNIHIHQIYTKNKIQTICYTLIHRPYKMLSNTIFDHLKSLKNQSNS